MNAYKWLEARRDLADVISNATRDYEDYLVGCREEEIDPQVSFEDFIAGRILSAGYRKQSEGEWIHEAPYTTYSGEYLKGSECSVCHSFFVSKGNEPWSDHSFCCECGAKMKGGTE